MKILLIDGQGGKMGRELTEAILRSYPQAELTVIGTNSVATASMIKGGAKLAATGENSVIVCSRTADVIICPVGAVIADSMLGEITPAMALAIGQSSAVKILIPSNRCNNLIAGITDMTVAEMISDAVRKLGEIYKA